MTLLVLAPVLLFAFIALKAFRYIRPIFRKRGVINAEVTGRLTETMNGVRVIKGFNAEEQENISFEKGVDRLFQNVKKSLTATAIMTSSATFLLGIASTGIMGIGGYKIMAGELTVGEFLSFTFLLGLMIAPIVQMSNIGSQLTEAFAKDFLKENQIEDFAMYPNPTNLGYVNVSSKNRAAMSVSVFDIIGKQVINSDVINNRLNVSQLKTGIYILKAQQGNAVTTKKLVIQ